MTSLPGPDPFLELFTASRRFSLGIPRQVQVAADGRSALFLRTRGATDPLTSLWRLDAGDPQPREVADPVALSARPGRLTQDEAVHARRTRSTATGITAYSAVEDLSTVVFAVAGQLYVHLDGQGTRRLDVGTPVSAVTLDPSGRRIGYVRDRAVWVTDLDGDARQLAAPDGDDVTWGLPELVSSEEIGRTRGFWWTDGGRRLLACRVDESQVDRWYLVDPGDPQGRPRSFRYPPAGGVNADVTLHVLDLDGGQVEVGWDRAEFPYLVQVTHLGERPVALVQTRDQRVLHLLGIDLDTGKTELLHADRAGHWLDIVAGLPAQLPDGRLVGIVEDADTRRLSVDGEPVTPPGLHVRAVVAADAEGVLFTASTDPREVHVWRAVPGGEPVRLTAEPGVHTASRSAGGLTVTSDTLVSGRPRVVVRTKAGEELELPVVAAGPDPLPRQEFRTLTGRGLHAAVLLPAQVPAGARLPVLLDPYGGPGAQRVLAVRKAYALGQWFADHGFAVVTLDGRGTPGRGLAWEHEIDGEVAERVVADQVEGLLELAATDPRLDLDRVAVRGWSFGGYLALQLALRHPDLIRAAVAGAPVTEWELYDTHYTERYLGTPQQQPDAYARSRVPDPPDRHLGRRPELLIVHGLQDDNVHPAHSLRMSARLLEHGWQHQTLYLPDAHHGVTDPAALRTLLRTELDFLRRALDVAGAGDD
ncbi:MAG TPA: alpha/beta fold hydrolase [Kineosporiaceae bacterium]|nr:alpha/beta fold hydrolase [Kineosporiaceae bacterium]